MTISDICFFGTLAVLVVGYLVCSAVIIFSPDFPGLTGTTLNDARRSKREALED